MTSLIEEYLSKKHFLQAIEECIKSEQYFLALFLSKLLNTKDYNELIYLKTAQD